MKDSEDLLDAFILLTWAIACEMPAKTVKELRGMTLGEVYEWLKNKAEIRDELRKRGENDHH